MEKNLTFTVHGSYFTQTHKKKFKIYTTDENAKKKSGGGMIDLRKIRKYIYSLYPGWHYFRVRTLRAIQLNELGKTGDIVFFNETQKEVELKSNPSYYDRLLTRYFNDETLGSNVSTKRGFPSQSNLYYVDLNQMAGSHVFIQPPVADIARSYYDSIDFSFRHNMQLDYEIVLYNRDSESDRILIDDYVVQMTQKNNALQFPLSAFLPGDSELETKDTFMIFIAVKENRILGYCSTEIIPYREEIDENLRNFYKEQFLLPAMEKNETEADVKEKSLLFSQYPGNLLEIQALSVDPDQKGNGIGQRLIRTALEFINDTRSQNYFPVTNIVTWSASFVTKIITKRFGFKYYGTNRFLNEHFLETLPVDRLDQFLSIMLVYSREVLSLMDNLFYFHTIGSQIAVSYTNLYKPLFSAVLSLLQLYIIILYSTQKGQRKGTTASLSLNLMLMLLRSQALFIYTKKFISLDLIEAVPGKELTDMKRWKAFFNEEREALFLSYSTIEEIDLLQLHGHLRVIENGFLSYKTIPKTNDEHRIKEPCNQGYDILFDIHYWLLLFEYNYTDYSELMDLPGLTIDFQYTLPPLLKSMTAFIDIDLKKPRNTMIPWRPQLVRIKEKLPLITDLLTRQQQRPIERFISDLNRQIIRQERWEILLKRLTDVFYQTYNASLLFDTILDFSTVSDILKENSIIVPNKNETRIVSPHVHYPSEFDERQSIFDELSRVIEKSSGGDALVLFRDQYFTLEALSQYWDNLGLLLSKEPVFVYDYETVVTRVLSEFLYSDSILNRIKL